MKVEVAVLGSPSIIVLMVSVDFKLHLKKWFAFKPVVGGDPVLTNPWQLFQPLLKSGLWRV